MLVTAFIAALFTSCSGDGKELTPTSTQFNSGDIARMVEVVDEPCEFTYAEKDGAIPTQIMRLKVKLKNIDGSLKGVDPRDISFTGLLSVATVKVNDANGIELVKLDVAESDMLKLKTLLAGEKDATDEIMFEGSFNNSEMAPEWFKNAATFAPDLTATISVNGALASNKAASQTESPAAKPVVADSYGAPMDEVSSYPGGLDEVSSYHEASSDEW